MLLHSATLYLATVAIWGSTWFAITFQLGVVAPEVSVTYRFALASATLLVYCRWRGLRLRFAAREHLYMGLQGLLLFGLNYVVFYEATAHMTSGLIAVAFSTIILMNIHSREGRVFRDAVELEGDELAEMLENGHQAWVNDAYWMFMPYKMLDPGVTLGYVGEKSTADGTAAWVLDLTFGAGVGYTPENRYHVYVGKESGLVEQLDFYADASSEEPNFAGPWKDWETFGRIKLATNHGRDIDWKIAVHDEFPAGLLSDPAAVAE